MTDETQETPIQISSARDFLGHTITIQPNWTFVVSGPEFSAEEKSQRQIFFGSFADARNEIQKRVEDSEKIRAQNIKFEAQVIDQSGETKTITRIDRRTGNIAGIDGRFVYPNIPWIKAALARKKILKSQLDKIEQNLSIVQIESGRTYSRIDAEDYPKRIATLDAIIKRKTEEARAMQQLKETESTDETKSA